MASSSADQDGKGATEGSWLGAEPPKRYTEISQTIDMKQVEVLNLDKAFGPARILFEKTKPSGLTSGNRNGFADVDWVESAEDEQLMLFIPFQGTAKVHTIQITSAHECSSEDDDEDEHPMRPKTIRLYKNSPHILHFEEADSLNPTQEVELGPDDWSMDTGTAVITPRFVKFQNISSLVMYIVNGDGVGEKVRLDRIRVFGESSAIKVLPDHLKNGNSATRSRKDDQLAYTVGKNFLVATLPRGLGNDPAGFDAATSKMAIDIAWQLGGIMQGGNKVAAGDDWLDRERWHRIGREIEKPPRTKQPVTIQDGWEFAAEQRSAQHSDMAQRGVNLWGLRGRSPKADIRGIQGPTGLEITTPIVSLAAFMTEKHSCKLCDQFRDYSLQYLSIGNTLKISVDLSTLQERAKACEFYKQLYSSMEPQTSPGFTEIEVFAEPLFLSVKDRPTDTHATDMPRAFIKINSSGGVGGETNKIPLQPAAGSDYEARLCRQWLRICDISHLHIDSYEAKLPTRVIDVGKQGSDYVRLRIANREAHGKYIALSHRWHNGTPTTITENLHDRRESIKLSSLPQIYQDAILLTRRLGIRFIWIDSLCILQDDRTDWFLEAEKMGEVYSSAYCTIAASLASDGPGNFEQHVNKGELSSRGWILQERALSRRTIHLTGKQTYWECGFAIWSKADDSGMRPQNVLASSNFPQVDAMDTIKQSSAAFQDVFTHYSKLHLTVQADKSVAIAGIERRLQNFYRTRSFYGIFQRFFIESLLWRRARNNRLKPLIDFKAKISEWTVSGYRVPSWSWMAYRGEIGYGGVCSDWLNCTTDVKLFCTESNDEAEKTHLGTIFHAPETLVALSGTLLQLKPGCKLTDREDSDCEIRDGNDIVGWARYDCENEHNRKCWECISIAEVTTSWADYADLEPTEMVLSGSISYVMLLAQESFDAYRRIGVAVVQNTSLSSTGSTARVF